MNHPITQEVSDALDLTPIEQRESFPVAPQASNALAVNSPAAMMMAAMAQGVSPEQVGKMMDLQERWERREAEKDYNKAFAAFKAEAVRIFKNREVTAGPLSGKSYAELHSVVNAVTPALSMHGLSASWKLTRDEPQWLEVTCILKHSGGHSESVSMGGPPDAGGAKNAIQARASTKSYLERYTLKAICGVAEGGDDDDGAGGEGQTTMLDGWCGKAYACESVSDLKTVSSAGAKAFQAARDKDGYSKFATIVQKHGAALRSKEPGNA